MRRLIFSCCLLLVAFILPSSTARGQNPVSYLNDTGATSYGVNIPVENGFIDASNGDLHLEFPLASNPQRGALQLNERLVYDSRIWMFSPFGTDGDYHWWPTNIYGSSPTAGGWRFISGGELGAINYTLSSYTSDPCGTENQSGGYDTIAYNSITWTDPTGTLHPTSATQVQVDDDCDQIYSQTIAGGSATDGSGYTISDDGTGNALVGDNSGTRVYPQIIDRYGNYWSSDGSGNLIDDTGRTPVIVTQNGNTTYYDVLAPNGTINNNGKRIRYTVTTALVPVATDFNQTDTHELDWPQTAGEAPTLNPVQSILLPDGVSQYSFTYDGYGELESMTLPTGGVIHYGYSNFLDSSSTENRWLSSMTVGSEPSMTFSPAVVTNCVNYSTGCVENVTLHKPSGDESVYALTLNNGAWNTGLTTYNGTVSAAQKLSQAASTYTYTNGCATTLNGCVGANYLSQALTTTMLFPGTSQTQNGSVYTQTQSVYDSVSGKITSSRIWDYVAVPAGTTAPSPLTTVPTRETDYSYTGLDTYQVKVLDSSGNQAGLTTYGYTSSATATSGVTQHGTQNAGGPYLHTKSYWLNTSTAAATTTYTSDDTGNVIQVTDAKGNPPSTISYQCSNSLPYQVTNSLSQVTQYGYDCSSGAITSVQDPNDLAANRSGTTYAYESVMGRVYTVTSPDTGVTTYSYPSLNEVDTSVTATPDPTITSQSISDTFGRPWKNIVGGTETDTTYDTNGRPYCTSNPFLTGSATPGSTCINYDGMDRPTLKTEPDGNTAASSYSANISTVTDEVQNAWVYSRDSFGRLTSVVEPSASGSPQTAYTYDGLGNVTLITQNGVPANGETPRIRSFTYDSMSRLICSSQPENSQNSCPHSATTTMPSGVTSFTYDLNSNLHSQTDSRNITTTYQYDALNRLTGKSYSDGTRTATFNYDETNDWGAAGCGGTGFVQCNTIGRLSSMATAGLTQSIFGYDAIGRTLLKSSCITSMCGNDRIDQYFSYDLAGNQTGYDHGTDIARNAFYGSHGLGYDSAGRLQSLTYTPAVSGPASTLFAATEYGPVGLLKSTLGNGLSETRSYDVRLRVQSYNAVNSNQTNAGASFSGVVDFWENYDVARFPNQSILGSSLPENGSITLSGWVGTAQGCPVASVQVYIDQTAIGAADLGVARPDVQQLVYNNDGQHAACGYNFIGPVGAIAPGTHTISVSATDASGNVWNIPMHTNTMTITSDPPPTGWVDGVSPTPVVAGGLLTVSGWGIDSQMHAPVGAVKLLIDGTPLGYATLGISRPDVASAYGDPRYTNSGWSFTGGIGGVAPGSHILSSIVYDSGGQSYTMTNGITVVADLVAVSESVVGFIDVAVNSANQSAIIPMGGSVSAYGWAGETANSSSCASNISRVDVLLDGNYWGQAQLGVTRSDVASASNNSSCLNSGWSFTGTVSNVDPGLHQMTTRAYDESGGSTASMNSQTIQVNAQLSPASVANSLPTQYSWSLGFQANGDVAYSFDSVNGNNAYLYDSLNRLVASQSGFAGFQWTYDSFGNRLSQVLTSGSGTSRYDTFSTANQPVGESFTSAGSAQNTIFRNQIAYDAENRIIGSDATSYIYDAQGERVAKLSGSSLTNVYLYDTAGRMVTELNGSYGLTRGEVYAGGRHLGTYDQNGNLTYALTDWLGTERARADGTGALCQVTTSQPFGDDQQTSGTCFPSPVFFTGKDRDVESTLDYFQARYLSSAIGRWMSPDPYNGSMDLGNPQSLNRYSYVNNSPVSATDPSGLLSLPVPPIDPIEIAIDALLAAADISEFLSGFFAHPEFTASQTPRPDARTCLTCSGRADPNPLDLPSGSSNGNFVLAQYGYPVQNSQPKNPPNIRCVGGGVCIDSNNPPPPPKCSDVAGLSTGYGREAGVAGTYSFGASLTGWGLPGAAVAGIFSGFATIVSLGLDFTSSFHIGCTP